ncbi:MAG: ATP-binding cassette domain-containing protein [Phycisphaerales bacterium]|nr:MAG: ATP-binding cassette domain-containing protein [Phycisphaerales bacterium]
MIARAAGAPVWACRRVGMMWGAALTNAIEMRGVRKTFGPKVAVEGLDLTVPEGSLTGLIGPNGAGKTTTIRMVMAIHFPDRGEMSILGRKSAVESKDRIGYLPEERGVYKKMKVGPFLMHMGRLKGLDSGPALKQRVADWLERVGLGDCWKKKSEELSKGMQQKVQFISAVLHEPDLLILDEPFSGLDPVNQRLLRDLVLEQHRAGRTVIFSTHVMFHAEQLCDRVIMIHNGRKVLDGTMGEIRAAHDRGEVVFEPSEGGADAGVRTVETLAGVESVRMVDGVPRAIVSNGMDRRAVMRSILDAVDCERVSVHRPTLEDVFIDIVEGSVTSEDERQRLRASLRGESGADEEAEVVS